jgi:hypothetical protein
LKFQTSKKINDSILERKLPKNNSNIKDDPYETLVLVYNMEMDQLMEANTISNKVEEKNFTTCPIGEMTKLDDEEKSMVPKTPCPKDAMTNEEKESMELVTSRIEMGFNDVSNTL